MHCSVRKVLLQEGYVCDTVSAEDFPTWDVNPTPWTRRHRGHHRWKIVLWKAHQKHNTLLKITLDRILEFGLKLNRQLWSNNILRTLSRLHQQIWMKFVGSLEWSSISNGYCQFCQLLWNLTQISWSLKVNAYRDHHNRKHMAKWKMTKKQDPWSDFLCRQESHCGECRRM